MVNAWCAAFQSIKMASQAFIRRQSGQANAATTYLMKMASRQRLITHGRNSLTRTCPEGISLLHLGMATVDEAHQHHWVHPS